MPAGYKKNIFSAAFTLLFVVNTFGQKTKVTSDFRVAGDIEVIKSLCKKWEVGIGTKCWFEKDASQIGEINLDTDIEYKPMKYIALGLGYRWTKNRNKNDVFISRHRISADIDFIKKIERFRINYRIRFQNVDEDFFQEDETNPARYIIRNCLQIKYNIPNFKITPFVSVEHYGQFGEEYYGIKIKPEIGAAYSFNKNHQISVYYRIDRELHNEYPFTFYSVGLGYLFEF